MPGYGSWHGPALPSNRTNVVIVSYLGLEHIVIPTTSLHSVLQVTRGIPGVDVGCDGHKSVHSVQEKCEDSASLGILNSPPVRCHCTVLETL